MSKRKINIQQQRRIQRIQDIRIERANKRAQTAEALLNAGDLGEEQPGLLRAHFGASVEVEDDQRRVFRCYLRQNLGQLVTGDRVIWRASDDKTGVVVAAEPRTSELLRPNPMGELKPVAANIEQMFLVFAPEPTPSEYLIDRYLVAAETLNIKTVLVINKWDLLNTAEKQAFLQRFAHYQTIAYDLLTLSATDATSLEPLYEQLRQHTNIFVGQSGVGKSSLVNSLLPDEDLRVGALSKNSGLGQHTTSTSRLYHLPSGGHLIDSPGVREFDLWHNEPQQIFDGFVEFRAYAGQCKFRDCKHQNEPDCAILAAVARQEIDSRRLHSYHRLIEDL